MSKKRKYKSIGGLLFNQAAADYKSIHHWIEAGSPDDCYVADTSVHLEIAGFPFRDALEHRGLYLRTAVQPKLPASISALDRINALLLPEVKMEMEGVQPVRPNNSKWTYHGKRPAAEDHNE